MGLKPGTRVPDFALPDQKGRLFSSSEVAGKRPLVIFFYPKDHTPGCTMEVCAFRDKYEDFVAHGAEVVGISSDTEQTHRSFAGTYRLPFRLLADKDGKVRSLFNVKGSLFNLIPGRETYVADASGVIRMVFHSVYATRHMEKALQALKGFSQ
jgi:peroxiredoxin Q/BCP